MPCACVQVEPGLSPETSQLKFIPREVGPYQVEMTYDGVPIPGSPYTPTAYPASDPSKVTALHHCTTAPLRLHLPTAACYLDNVIATTNQ